MFVSYIEPGQSIQVEKIDNGGYFGITWIAAGHSPTDGKTYQVAAELSPYDDDTPEYSFFIIERDIYCDIETSFLSGLDLPSIFSKADRRALLDAALCATEVLIRWKMPPRMYRCTYDANPPSAALEKHFLLSAVMLECGYRVTKCDPWHGKIVWIAERSDLFTHGA
jgi:hypothetical protein